MEFLAQVPGWLKYGMASGLMLVVLSRIILASDSRLKNSKTGLLISTGSVTLTVMLTLAFTGADEHLIPEFVFVAATGGFLFAWDCVRLYGRRRGGPVEDAAEA